MKSPITVNIPDKKIYVNKNYSKRASIYGTQEYDALQKCKEDHEGFEILIRSIKKNANKETYKGLTYDYMQRYILKYSDSVEKDLKELEDKLFIAECHSIKYPTIKRWFLNKYPEIEEFGIDNSVNSDSDSMDLVS